MKSGLSLSFRTAGFLVLYALLLSVGLAQNVAGPQLVRRTLPIDYLPLKLGNRWIYTYTESRFNKKDLVRVEIISTPIIHGKTYYIFSHLPFAPKLETANNIPIRYEDATNQLMRLTQEGEVPLFPADEDADARFDVSVDESGQLFPNRMSYLTCADCPDRGIEIVFDRGVGVTAVQNFQPWGSETFELRSAEVNNLKFGDPIPVDKPKASGPRPGSPVISRADPTLSLIVEKKEDGARLLLKVKNPTDSLLSFHFKTSQSYDFVVREEDGFEIWRWSKGYFFSKVIRNQALLPEQELQFEAFWNFKDNERNDIRQGKYQISGIFTTREPRETEPVSLTAP